MVETECNGNKINLVNYWHETLTKAYSIFFWRDCKIQWPNGMVLLGQLSSINSLVCTRSLFSLLSLALLKNPSSLVNSVILTPWDNIKYSLQTASLSNSEKITIKLLVLWLIGNDMSCRLHYSCWIILIISLRQGTSICISPLFFRSNNQSPTFFLLKIEYDHGRGLHRSCLPNLPLSHFFPPSWHRSVCFSLCWSIYYSKAVGEVYFFIFLLISNPSSFSFTQSTNTAKSDICRMKRKNTQGAVFFFSFLLRKK